MAPPEDEFVPDRPVLPPAPSMRQRPDWLVGADEGLVAEPGGAPDPPDPAVERPRLRRLDGGSEGVPPPRTPGLVGNDLSQQGPAPPSAPRTPKAEGRGAIPSEAPMTFG